MQERSDSLGEAEDIIDISTKQIRDLTIGQLVHSRDNVLHGQEGLMREGRRGTHAVEDIVQNQWQVLYQSNCVDLGKSLHALISRASVCENERERERETEKGKKSEIKSFFDFLMRNSSLFNTEQ